DRGGSRGDPGLPRAGAGLGLARRPRRDEGPGGRRRPRGRPCRGPGRRGHRGGRPRPAGRPGRHPLLGTPGRGVGRRPGDRRGRRSRRAVQVPPDRDRRVAGRRCRGAAV
ncbi:MAG: hypothetical protein AVDCRST_MAG36-2766, partial [uncultured Nocardioidaceae bacterium]